MEDKHKIAKAILGHRKNLENWKFSIKQEYSIKEKDESLFDPEAVKRAQKKIEEIEEIIVNLEKKL